MKTGTMGSGRFGRFVVALGALSLGLLVTGCGEECVDRIDCANKRGAPPEGKQYLCVDSRCEVRDIADPGTDAGTDAGTDTGPDAGTDAGVTCADLPHDEKLGTLQLQTGFAAAESVALPAGIGAVSAVQSGSDFQLYGLTGGSDSSLYALGTWPAIAASTTPLRPVVPEADQGANTFPSGYLTNDGTRLLTGYTMLGENFPGKVLVYDTATPAESTYVSAAGNFSAAAVPGAFLINGVGIEGVAEGGSAIYALKTDAKPFQGTKLATFPVAGVFSGYTAVTSDNIAVLGYAASDASTSDPFDTINYLTAVAPAVYTPAISGGTTFVLTNPNAIEIYAKGDLQGVAGFGTGVALHRGTFTATKDISRIELTVGGITPSTVTAGDLTSVLTTSNTCTNVVGMTPMGADLLVGVADKNGRRLVRLQQR